MLVVSKISVVSDYIVYLKSGKKEGRCEVGVV